MSKIWCNDQKQPQNTVVTLQMVYFVEVMYLWFYKSSHTRSWDLIVPYHPNRALLKSRIGGRAFICQAPLQRSQLPILLILGSTFLCDKVYSQGRSGDPESPLHYPAVGLGVCFGQLQHFKSSNQDVNQLKKGWYRRCDWLELHPLKLSVHLNLY